VSTTLTDTNRTPLDDAIRYLEHEAEAAVRDRFPALPFLVAWAEAGIYTSRALVASAMAELKGVRVVHDMHLDCDLSDIDAAVEHARASLVVIEMCDLVTSLADLTPDAQKAALGIIGNTMSALIAAELVEEDAVMVWKESAA
jgi:hypothetical protein